MKLIARIKNLWKISSIDKPVFFDENRAFHTYPEKEKEIQEAPKRQAQIIKKRDPIAEALKEEI